MGKTVFFVFFFFTLLLQNIPKHKLSTTVHKSSTLISELIVAIGLFQILQPDSAQCNEIFNLPIVSCSQVIFRSVQFVSVSQSCPTLCDPMNCSMPGLHVHQVGDAIQPSHLLSSLILLPPIPPSIMVFSNESTLLMR